MSKNRRLVVALAIALTAALTGTSGAAPSGPPVRIGGTLALTGPLAATALLHKIAREIYIDEMNRGTGLLGRPVEWVLLDDQSKAEVTRSLYERLITIDKVDLLMGPYATNAILAAMAVAQRYQRCSFTTPSAFRISRSTRCTSRRRLGDPSLIAPRRAWSSMRSPRPRILRRLSRSSPASSRPRSTSRPGHET